MQIRHNFLPEQYKITENQSINHNYLREQFSDYKNIFLKIEELINNCAYTLGEPVDEFEGTICKLTGSKYCIAVGSGTDALFLSLKAIGIKAGDEVITTPYTFFATIGAIVTAGATPVFVDVADDYNINPDLIEAAITPKTKAILPVHWSGIPCQMDEIMNIARRHDLKVIEDACHAIDSLHNGKAPGTFGDTGCFSMHPLKNLNVWGDGGFIVTNSSEIHDKLVLLRNHGLINRDECLLFAYNSRLDALQAIVANHLLPKLNHITNKRIEHAQYFDDQLKNIEQITIPERMSNSKNVYHIYVIRAESRNNLKDYLTKNGIDAKVHYPIPMHLQPASKKYGYNEGDFPNAEKICDSVISLPVHEFITRKQQDFVVQKIKEFYDFKSGNVRSIVKMSHHPSVNVPFVNLGLQYESIRNEIISKFDEISSKGAYILSDEVKKFEETFADFCGTKYAIGVANGTDALMLSLKAVGVKEGDEIIIPPNSFIATAGAIISAGATPVFVDVKEDYNIDQSKIQGVITSKTKAIIPVHLTGKSAEMDLIIEIAKRNNIHIIEDAAQAVGASYKGKSVGSFGLAGCFSLHPLKNLHVHGDGGIITTNDSDFYQKLKRLQNHGLINRDESELWGYNSRLDAIQAGIGLIKLNYINQWNQRFREIAKIYRKELEHVVTTPIDELNSYSVYHNFVIQCDNREELQKFLLERGIETKVHYPIPLHLQKAAAHLGYKRGDFPVTEYQSKKILSLPIYPELTDKQVLSVIEAIKSFFSR